MRIRHFAVRRSFRPAISEALEGRRLLAGVPALSSRPGAPDVLFLDFDGNAAFDWHRRDASGTLLNTRVHGPNGVNDPVPAYSWDTDLTTFSDDDRAAMTEVWRDVAGKFGMFNLNVTTVDPGSRADGYVVHVLYGGADSDWNNGGNGGISSIGAYNESDEDNDCFVFSRDNAAPSDAPYFAGTLYENFLAETADHEAGHVYGLTHQRKGSGGTPNTVVQEYYTGDANRIPTMGAANTNYGFKKRQMWWKTNMEPGQKSPDTVVDDLLVLNGAGLDYAVDDYNGTTGSTIALAVQIHSSTVNQTGVINSVLDQDAFKFVAGGPVAQFTVDSALDGDALAGDVSLRAYPSFTTITSGVTFTRTVTGTTMNVTGLTPGTTYAIVVSGRFTDAYDLGGYGITGTVGGFAAFNDTTGKVDVYGYGNLNNNIHVSINSGGGLVITDTFGTGTGTFVYPAFETYGVNFNLGNGNDTVTLEKLGPFRDPVTFNGGGGSNTLSLQGAANVSHNFNITGGHIVWAAGNVISTINTVNARLEAHGGNSGNAFIANQTWLPGGPTSLGFYGGSGYDVAYADDAAGTVGQDWHVDGSTARLFFGGGIDNAFSYSGVEGFYLNGGAGDDSITLGGDDHVVDSLAAIQFVLTGGDGYDNVTYDDAMGRRGGGADDGYVITNGHVIHNVFDISDYQLDDVFYDAIEAYHLNLPTRDTANTTVEVDQVRTGTLLDIVGGAGAEFVTLGTPGSGLADVNGAVYVYGGGGDDFLDLDDRADTVGRQVHDDGSYINAAPGDDLFGAGGYVYYYGYSGSIEMYLGSGVDTAYVTPGSATIFVSAGAQNARRRAGGDAEGGDLLGLALANVTGVTFTPNGATGGTYHFADASPVIYAGVENVSIDDVAPTVVDAHYSYDAAVPSVDVTFNEDVVTYLSSYYIVLTNTTTGEEIPYSDLAYDYDASTYTGHFALPANVNGQFADGQYTAYVRAGLVDSFGNAQANDTPFSFFVLAGDADHDGTVGFNDLVKLAQSYNQVGHSFSEGNFDYSPDGAVDFNDLVLLAQRYGHGLLTAASLSTIAGLPTTSGKRRAGLGILD